MTGRTRGRFARKIAALARPDDMKKSTKRPPRTLAGQTLQQIRGGDELKNGAYVDAAIKSLGPKVGQ